MRPLSQWAQPEQRRAAFQRGLGLPLDRLVWVDPATEADAAWAAEQVLRCGAGAVLWWSRRVLPATLRRLHLAALESGTPLFGLRPLAQRAQSSPAPLRLALEAAGRRLKVDVFKRRGPALATPLAIDIGSPARRRAVPSPLSHALALPAPAVVAA